MHNIDRLGWAAGTSIRSFGVRIGIRVNNPSALDVLGKYLPPGWRPSADTVVDRLYSLIVAPREPKARIRRLNILYGDTAQLARSVEVHHAYERLETDIQNFVAEKATRHVFFHAGVVGWRGQAILLPGRTLSGKTTLVRELVRAGATYFSDEYAVMDRRGRVHPFPCPMGIRQGGVGAQSRHEIETLGGTSGTRSLPVGMVILTEYEPGRRWRARRLSPGRGALELLSHAVPARRRPKAVLSVLREVVTQAKFVNGVRGDGREAALKILDIIDDDPSWQIAAV